REVDYDIERAYEWLLDTIQWRREQGIPDMSYISSAGNFYSDTSGGFAFFHKQDQLGRPMVIVRMRYFPQIPKSSTISLTELIRPYACLIMEMARKIMLGITRQRKQDGTPCALVSQMVVIIDMAKSPFIPIDAQLVKVMLELMEKRFPDFVGSIYIMNFGWMYQGLWQMIKYLLSDEARSRISFPNVKEILEVVPQENLLRGKIELGGTDDYVWSIDNDTALEKYGMGSTAEALIESTISPPASPPLSLRRSSISSSISSDDFFDVNESFYDAQSISSAYATPGSWSPTTLSSTHQYNVYYWTGLHMGAAFMTSFIKSDHDEQHPHITIAALFSSHPTKNNSNNNVKGEHKEIDDLALMERHTPHFPHLLPPDDPQSAYALAPFRMRIHHIEHKLVRWARRIFHMTFAYKGAVYWVILYIFLRGPTEHVLKRTLTTVVDTPQQVKYTTVGITAAMAAAIGSSISFSLNTATPRI
ncbi:CRAL/TRIO domain-containing protein, partial [Lichtheimia hyalospora FSU 10163]